MRLWEKIDSVIQIVYRMGRSAEAMTVRHTKEAKAFFDFGDLFAIHKNKSASGEFDPAADEYITPEKLVAILKALQDLSVETAEAYAEMGRALDTCIIMIDDTIGKVGSKGS